MYWKYISSKYHRRMNWTIPLSNRKGCRHLIVQTSVECSKTINTFLVGEDTDLLVLLWYHMNTDYHDIVFQSEIKASLKNIKIWDIKRTKTIIGQELCKILPFVHATSVCDTTSRLFGEGKGQSVKKASNDIYVTGIFYIQAFCKMPEMSGNL